jgi:hypothetical protein
VGGMLGGKPGLLHCHMGAGGPPRSGGGGSAPGGSGASAASAGAAAAGHRGRSAMDAGGTPAERDPLAPLFDAVDHSDVPVRGPRLLPLVTCCLLLCMCVPASSVCRAVWAHTTCACRLAACSRHPEHMASRVQITQFLPTHCERCDGTIDGAIRWMRAGGNIDLTAGQQVRPVTVVWTSTHMI